MRICRRLLLPLLALLGACAGGGARRPLAVPPDRVPRRLPNGSGRRTSTSGRLAAPLSRALGVPVVVNNRVGAGGNIASDMVAKARPDGYLILFGTAGTHAINQTLYRRLPFDVLRDFTPIAHLGDVPNVLTTSIERRPQYRTCMDLISDAKARPGALNYASTGNGASTTWPARASPRRRGSTWSMCPSRARAAPSPRCSAGRRISSSTRPDRRSA
jgi:hypothetical protein